MGGEAAPLDWDRMFAQAPFGMALLSLPDYRLLTANQALLDLANRSLDAVAGQPLLSQLVSLPPGMSPAALCGEVLPVVLPGAAAHWVRLSVTEGSETALIVIDDVSEQKSLEAQMIHIDRLSQLGGLAVTLQHDLSQPLNIIRLTAENALDRLEEGGPFDEGEHARQVRCLSMVMQQLKRAQEIFDQTWSYGHPPEASPGWFDLSMMVEAAIARVTQRPAAARMSLEWRSPAKPVRIFGHGQRLEEVLFQLLLNSCEAMASYNSSQAGKAISGIVTVGCIVDRDLDQLTLSITDNGPGLSPGLMRRLTSPELSSRPAGKGLGLLVAFGITAEMGGWIELPKTGQGTRFDIVLPLGGDDEETTPPNEEETE